MADHVTALAIMSFDYARVSFEIDHDAFMLIGSPKLDAKIHILMAYPVRCEADINSALGIFLQRIRDMEKSGYILSASGSRGFRLRHGYDIEAIAIQAQLDHDGWYDLQDPKVQAAGIHVI